MSSLTVLRVSVAAAAGVAPSDAAAVSAARLQLHYNSLARWRRSRFPAVGAIGIGGTELGGDGTIRLTTRRLYHFIRHRIDGRTASSSGPNMHPTVSQSTDRAPSPSVLSGVRF